MITPSGSSTSSVSTSLSNSGSDTDYDSDSASDNEKAYEAIQEALKPNSFIDFENLKSLIEKPSRPPTNLETPILWILKCNNLDPKQKKELIGALLENDHISNDPQGDLTASVKHLLDLLGENNYSTREFALEILKSLIGHKNFNPNNSVKYLLDILSRNTNIVGIKILKNLISHSNFNPNEDLTTGVIEFLSKWEVNDLQLLEKSNFSMHFLNRAFEILIKSRDNLNIQLLELFINQKNFDPNLAFEVTVDDKSVQITPAEYVLTIEPEERKEKFLCAAECLLNNPKTNLSVASDRILIEISNAYKNQELQRIILNSKMLEPEKSLRLLGGCFPTLNECLRGTRIEDIKNFTLQTVFGGRCQAALCMDFVIKSYEEFINQIDEIGASNAIKAQSSKKHKNQAHGLRGLNHIQRYFKPLIAAWKRGDMTDVEKISEAIRNSNPCSFMINWQSSNESEPGHLMCVNISKNGTLALTNLGGVLHPETGYMPNDPNNEPHHGPAGTQCFDISKDRNLFDEAFIKKLMDCERGAIKTLYSGGKIPEPHKQSSSKNREALLALLDEPEPDAPIKKLEFIPGTKQNIGNCTFVHSQQCIKDHMVFALLEKGYSAQRANELYAMYQIFVEAKALANFKNNSSQIKAQFFKKYTPEEASVLFQSMGRQCMDELQANMREIFDRKNTKLPLQIIVGMISEFIESFFEDISNPNAIDFNQPQPNDCQSMIDAYLQESKSYRNKRNMHHEIDDSSQLEALLQAFFDQDYVPNQPTGNAFNIPGYGFREEIYLDAANLECGFLGLGLTGREEARSVLLAAREQPQIRALMANTLYAELAGNPNDWSQALRQAMLQLSVPQAQAIRNGTLRLGEGELEGGIDNRGAVEQGSQLWDWLNHESVFVAFVEGYFANPNATMPLYPAGPGQEPIPSMLDALAALQGVRVRVWGIQDEQGELALLHATEDVAANENAPLIHLRFIGGTGIGHFNLLRDPLPVDLLGAPGQDIELTQELNAPDIMIIRP